MAIKRDLLVDKLLDAKQYNTVYISKEDEQQAHRIQIDTLVELLCDSQHKAARPEVLKFLKKEPRAIDILIKAIAESKGDKKVLTAVCWEANLDCARYLPFFTDIVLKDNFEVALEAFTVIEQMTGEVSSQQASDLIMKVKESYKAQSETPKAPLLLDLVELLHRWE